MQKHTAMKSLIYIITLVTVIFLGSCCEQEEKATIEEERDSIENILEKYILGNENENFDLIEEIWSPADDIILYGTDTDERLVGWPEIQSAIKAQFDDISDTYISASNQVIKFNSTGNTAWFAETLNYNYIYNGKAHKYEGLRFTGVVEKMNGTWKLVQAHLSVPASVGVGD